jgi:hypothetical protein
MENLPADADRIEHDLLAELEHTQELYREARAHFRSVTRSPSGIPYPDGILVITQATERHNDALEAYRIALRRFNDYVIRRVVPADLKP